MKTFYKIKRIGLLANGDIFIHLQNGNDVVMSGEDFISYQYGNILTPLYDELTEEVIGFIDA